MGSLMAGWSTKPSKEEEISKRSTSSLTKEEVDKFWKMKRTLMEEHQQEAQKDVEAGMPDSPSGIVKQMADETAAKAEAANLASSLPEENSAWWTRSNWAFLNDPPAADTKQHRYVPQFDVAMKGQMAQELNSVKSSPNSLH